uniref:GTP cyclohydrolase FolE2 n=1 Tax=Cellvibrio fontiphilus TaxID=1815559 RepID=UPI002B4BD9F9|nr:GTP cyclohydrolase FolE2 [Cellvibrio fontiphilus]
MTDLSTLPDIASQQAASIPLSIDWVGMNGIALHALQGGSPLQLQLDINVNLPNPSAKGIHMSRLYQLAQTHLANVELTQGGIAELLYAVIESHRDLGSTAAKLTLRTQLLLKRPALISELEGWKFYPLRLDAQWDSNRNQAELRLQVGVDYSSTCPCSAALSRQLLQEAFLAHWKNEWRYEPPTAHAIGEWLAQHGSVATPHSQRSQALVSVSLGAAPHDAPLPISELVDAIENALGTPVQTAVKRVDEQAFAKLNGENLMYVEDAVRRLQAALQPQFSAVNIQVIHRESLHQHDAVASIHSAPAVPF